MHNGTNNSYDISSAKYLALKNVNSRKSVKIRWICIINEELALFIAPMDAYKSEHKVSI